jgi:hypothetical protein
MRKIVVLEEAAEESEIILKTPSSPRSKVWVGVELILEP